MVFDGFIMFLMDHGVCLCDVSIISTITVWKERLMQKLDLESGAGQFTKQ